MKTKSQSIIVHSSPEKVFAFMDEISKTGMHMTKSNMPMMGGKLELKQLSPNANGPHAKFQWKGNVLWMKLDFTVEVTEWKKNKIKVWETVGEAKIIILSWYRMRLSLTPVKEGTLADLSISYTTPQTVFEKILAFFLADWYANWCLKNMLNDSKKALEQK